MVIWSLLLSVGLLACSGAPGLLAGRRSALGQWIALALNVVASGIGLISLVAYCVGSNLPAKLSAPWSLPFGRFAVSVDGVAIPFLIPIFVVSALGSVYGLSYWRQHEHTGNGQKLRLCWGLLAGGMAMVVLARDGVLFLMAWEVMALSAFFLVDTEDHKRESRGAAWIYLVATHVGTLCLFGFFALLRRASGSFELWSSLAGSVTAAWTVALFLLGVIGFGLKAGLMPLHVWLPGAHANAPSHVSAVMSGVLLNTGVYGIARLTALMPHPPAWCGATLMIAGGTSALVGIAFAGGQRDLKRLLAYSSIENIGIVVLGLGLATLGRSLGRVDWVVLGMGGALLHMLNHSLFKPLLFFGAGAILHGAHTREIDRMGGLGKGMPRTFILFIVGAVAICGLPPLNGFASELLLYVGFFRAALPPPAQWGWVALGAPALALVGAFAVASFVKVIGAAFCGSPRNTSASKAHDPDQWMLGPMWLLAACCVLVGVFPAATLGVLDVAVLEWASSSSAERPALMSYVPFGWLTVAGVVFFAMTAIACMWIMRSRPRWSTRRAGTWDCGYARPTPRMQYTGSSFSQMLVDLLAWVLWPRTKSPRLDGVFPKPSEFASDVPDVVLDRGLLPAFSAVEWFFGLARQFQRGPVHAYLLYVLGILLMLLLLA